jgi:uncharacterized protein (TIGR03083 family)
MTTTLPIATPPPTPATNVITDALAIPALGHLEAMGLATTEFARMVELLEQLTAGDWQQPTVCTLWNVQEMVAHVVGMAEAQASFGQFLHDFRCARKRTGGAMIDALNATQVRERADQTTTQLIDRLVATAPRAVKSRRRTPSVMRSVVRFQQDPPFEAEKWTYGFLVDTIFTRDTWMHRNDISRATGRAMVVTHEHDGRLVAGVVAEWARRHGQPFSLTLTGEAGGRWQTGTGGERIELDALEFCWTVSGRAAGHGLLTTFVPF